LSLKRTIYGMPFMRFYREMRTAQLASRFVDTGLGFRFAGNPHYLSPSWEAHEKRIIGDYLSQVSVFIDVGANHGFYSCLAAMAGAEVAAIEPEEGNLRFLKSNVAANGLAVEIFPMAVADKPGTLELYGDGDMASLIPGWAGSRAAFRQIAPVNTLDNLFAGRWPDRPLFIKVDVEGVEAAVLKGASDLIRRRDAIWLIETFPTSFGGAASPGFRDVFELMQGHLVFLADEKLTPVTGEMIEAWAMDPSRPGRGGSNFLFVPPDR
jgi:FkbM family methyltransferase